MDATLSRSAAAGPPSRADLAQRIRASAPAIVAVTAPAGYGKSTFARAMLVDAAAMAVCDCRGVTSSLDLARRVVPALADEDPARAGALAQVETLLGGTHTAVGDRLGPVLAAWRASGRPSIFVLENAEDVLASPGPRELLGKLLAERPEHRMLVICSRAPVRLHLSRFAAPHRIVHVLAGELAFSADEARAVFTRSGASAASVERAIAVAAGWPIAVLLLARFAHEGRLDALLDSLGDVAFDELHDYLAEQIFDAAPEGIVDGLLAATLPRATERDVRLALGDEAAFDAFRTFAKTSPFVTEQGGRYSVHPLVVAMLYERYRERADTLLAAAAMVYEDAGEFQRAAEIQLACGDHAAAASALERAGSAGDDTPTLDYARVLAGLEREVVLQHPQLWSVSALARAFTADPRTLLDELETVWSGLPASAPPAVRMALYVFRVLMMGQLGELDRALELIDDLRRRIAVPDVPVTRMHAWLLALHAFVAGPLGRTRLAERDLTAAAPLVGSIPFMSAGALVTLGAQVARVRGDYASERERLERAIDQATAADLRNFAALARAEAAFGAWLAGDDASYGRHGFALGADVEREGVRAFAFLAAAMRKHVVHPEPADQAKFVAAGHLIAAADARDEAAALRHADGARDVAAVAREPFVQVLAALAVAELSAPRRATLLDEAKAHAQRIDSPELQAAVDAFARGAPAGFLEHFAQRYRRPAQPQTSPGTLVVELVSGRVLRDGEPLVLAEREHALLTAIALRAEPLSRERLTDLLWPDLSESAARNAFHVCLHRAKARLADDAAIVRTREGYRLGGAVEVDLWEIERDVSALRNDAGDGEAQTAALRALYERLRPSRPPKFDGWEWFEPTERRLRELRCEVAQRLATRELEAGRPGDALALCQEMIGYDPCDEPAREIAIRSYLAMGDRAAALRHFRQYRDVLDAELQCEPSDALAALVGANT